MAGIYDEYIDPAWKYLQSIFSPEEKGQMDLSQTVLPPPAPINLEEGKKVRTVKTKAPSEAQKELVQRTQKLPIFGGDPGATSNLLSTLVPETPMDKMLFDVLAQRRTPSMETRFKNIQESENLLNQPEPALTGQDYVVGGLMGLSDIFRGTQHVPKLYEESKNKRAKKLAERLGFEKGIAPYTGDEIALLKGQFQHMGQMSEQQRKALLAEWQGLKTMSDMLKGTGEETTTTEVEGEKEVLPKQVVVKPGKGKGKGGGLDLTPLERKRDEQYGKLEGTWLQEGGFKAVNNNIEQLKRAKAKIQDLEKNSMLGASGKAVGLANTLGLGKFLTPEQQALKQQVDEISAQGLKGILPGAISNFEVNFITSLKYDPTLPAGENIKKINQALIYLMKGRNQTKKVTDWVREKRTLKGIDYNMPGLQ